MENIKRKKFKRWSRTRQISAKYFYELDPSYYYEIVSSCVPPPLFRLVDIVEEIIKYLNHTDAENFFSAIGDPEMAYIFGPFGPRPLRAPSLVSLYSFDSSTSGEGGRCKFCRDPVSPGSSTCRECCRYCGGPVVYGYECRPCYISDFDW